MENILKELLKKQQLAKVSHDVAGQLASAYRKLDFDCDSVNRSYLESLRERYRGLEDGYFKAILVLLGSDAVPTEYKKMKRLWFSLELKCYDLDHGAA